MTINELKKSAKELGLTLKKSSVTGANGTHYYQLFKGSESVTSLLTKAGLEEMVLTGEMDFYADTENKAKPFVAKKDEEYHTPLDDFYDKQKEGEKLYNVWFKYLDEQGSATFEFHKEFNLFAKNEELAEQKLYHRYDEDIVTHISVNLVED